MNKILIDIGLLIKPVSSYRFEDVAERLVKLSVPHFFELQQPGGTLSGKARLLLAVTCTPGVRTCPARPDESGLGRWRDPAGES